MRTSGMVLTLLGALGLAASAVAQSPVVTTSSTTSASARPFHEIVARLSQATTERELHAAYAEALEGVPANLEEMARLVRTQSAHVEARTVAIWALGERGGPDACSAVMGASSLGGDEIYGLAWATARARCSDNAALLAIVERNSESVLLRAKAAATLGMLRDTRSLATVQRLASASEDGSQERVILTVARGLMGDRAVMEDLRLLLKDRAMHMHAAIAMARMDLDYVVFDLQAATKSRESLVRWAAADLLTARRLPGACEVLEPMQQDPDLRVAAMTSGVINGWADEAWQRWQDEGFAMEHFGEHAYCP